MSAVVVSPWVAEDWLIRVALPIWLRPLGEHRLADNLADLPKIDGLAAYDTHRVSMLIARARVRVCPMFDRLDRATLPAAEAVASRAFELCRRVLLAGDFTSPDAGYSVSWDAAVISAARGLDLAEQTRELVESVGRRLPLLAVLTADEVTR